MPILDTMEQIRTEYPVGWSHAQRGEYLNRVALELRRTGEWPNVGLLSKPGGNNCPNPAGQPCSCDYLVDRVTLNGYDVLVDETDPTWPGFDHPSDNFSNVPDRWVAPVGSVPDPDPDPQPDPQPDPDPIPDDPDLDKLLAEIIKQIGIQNQQIADIVAFINRPLVVEGDTGRNIGHRHSVNLTVRRV